MDRFKLKVLASIIISTCLLSCSSGSEPESPAPAPAVENYIPLVQSHLDKIIDSGTDRFGPKHTAMWCSNIDTRNGQPLDASHVPQRVYRLIGAPGGSTLYWDQPLAVSACLLSDLTGDAKYKAAVDAYLDDFLATSVDTAGMFVWGNHQYYDVYGDTLVYFHGGYHEMRPLTPAWELFWRHDSAACSRFIRTMAGRHIFDETTGGFNRHDDGKDEHPFLEAGAVLTETLAWLYRKERDPQLKDLALKVGEYSYGFRGEATGLVRSSPGSGRWDDFTGTTEVGVWAQAMLKGYEYTGEQKFAEMAADAVSAYLRYGYDQQAGLYYGQLNTDDGTHREPEEKGYWPGTYSDIWNNDQWPTHDYPMNFAEVCLMLHIVTGRQEFADGVERWAGVVSRQQYPESGAYAENFGRVIHFLVRAGIETGRPALLKQARDIADLAVQKLYENGMFQGFSGSHTYEAVDGTGYLCLALLALENPQTAGYLDFRF